MKGFIGKFRSNLRPAEQLFDGAVSLVKRDVIIDVAIVMVTNVIGAAICAVTETRAEKKAKAEEPKKK